MILLSDITHTIDFTMTTLAVTNPLEFYTAYVDITVTSITPVEFQGVGFSAGGSGSFSFVSAPAASTQRQIKVMSVYNADTAAMTFKFSQSTSGTRRTIFACTLQVGETLLYMSDVGWTIYGATGRALSTAGDVVGPSSATDNAIARFDATTGKLIQNSLVTIDDSGNVVLAGLVDGVDISTIAFASPWAQRVWMSPLNRGGAAKILTSGTAYFCYVGCTVNAITPKFVEFQVSTIAAGAQTAEVGLFSSPLGPNKAGQSLTKLVATSTVDTLVSTGVKRNTSAFATSIPAGTHLWAGIRTAMATTQPTIEGLNFDMSQGMALVTAGAGVLTGAGPFAGALLGTPSLHGATSDVPDLRVTLD